jgi:hypothetical protein
VTLATTRHHAILDLCSDTDEPEDDWFEAGHLAASLTPLRADLLGGDYRAAYLAWLVAVQTGEVDDDIDEPLLPLGLADPHAPLAALAGFLRLDPYLLAAAAEASRAGTTDTNRLRAWVRTLLAAEQQRWLLRAVDEPDRRLGADLRAEFRRTHAAAPPAKPRTVGYLLARADELRDGRRHQAAKPPATVV